MRKLVIAIVLSMLFTGVFHAQDANGVVQEVSGTPQEICDSIVPVDNPETREYTQAEQVIQSDVDYRAIFCTSAGAIYIDLFEDAAPETVNNLVFLASNGYYNNTVFHRVIADFMAQGGDPTATGAGGPGYQFGDEFVGYLTFEDPGWLAMANAGPGTNGSQFFITTAPTTHLDFAHTIFGQVLAGQENVENIQLRDPAVGGDATSLDTVIIVTDESDVDVQIADPTVFTSEEALDAFVNLTGVLATDGITITVPESSLDADMVGEFWGNEVLASAFAENGHTYTLYSEVSNDACDFDNFPFANLSYALHGFESVDQADQVLGSGVFDEYATDNGFVYDETLGIYTREVEGCDTALIEGLSVLARGRFIAMATASITADAPYTVDLIIDQIALLAHENIMNGLLRSGIR